MNGNTERANAPFLESAFLKKRKRKSMSSDSGVTVTYGLVNIPSAGLYKSVQKRQL